LDLSLLDETFGGLVVDYTAAAVVVVNFWQEMTFS
jgi:hypothetical protein